MRALKWLFVLVFSLLMHISSQAQYTYQYTVMPGESLYRIGQRFGISYKTIMRRNRLSDTNIQPGQVLLLDSAVPPNGIGTVSVANPNPISTSTGMITRAVATTPVQASNTNNSYREHYVSPGETLNFLASYYEVPVAAIMAANALSTDRLFVGQTLMIPPTCVSGASGSDFLRKDTNYIPPNNELWGDGFGTRGISQGMTRYTVQKGDTLYKLAKRYRTTVLDIQSANGLYGDRIKRGQVLVIPMGTF